MTANINANFNLSQYEDSTMYFQATFSKSSYPCYFHCATWRAAKIHSTAWAKALMEKHGLSHDPKHWRVDFQSPNAGFFRLFGDEIVLRFCLVDQNQMDTGPTKV